MSASWRRRMPIGHDESHDPSHSGVCPPFRSNVLLSQIIPTLPYRAASHSFGRTHRLVPSPRVPKSRTRLGTVRDTECGIEGLASRAHPPLGNWIIGLGIKLFGYDAFGWRVMAAVAGTITVALLYLLMRRLLAARLAPTAASVGALATAGLLATDFLHLVQSRVGMLDASLTLFVVAAVLFAVLDRDRARDRPGLLPRRLAAAAGTGTAVVAAHRRRARRRRGGRVVRRLPGPWPAAADHCLGDWRAPPRPGRPHGLWALRLANRDLACNPRGSAPRRGAQDLGIPRIRLVDFNAGIHLAGCRTKISSLPKSTVRPSPAGGAPSPFGRGAKQADRLGQPATLVGVRCRGGCPALLAAALLPSASVVVTPEHPIPPPNPAQQQRLSRSGHLDGGQPHPGRSPHAGSLRAATHPGQRQDRRANFPGPRSRAVYQPRPGFNHPAQGDKGTGRRAWYAPVVTLVTATLGAGPRPRWRSGPPSPEFKATCPPSPSGRSRAPSACKWPSLIRNPPWAEPKPQNRRWRQPICAQLEACLQTQLLYQGRQPISRRLSGQGEAGAPPSAFGIHQTLERASSTPRPTMWPRAFRSA